MNVEEAREVASNPAALAELIGRPVDQWPGHCHEVSLALVKSGAFGQGARVARGTAKGVISQHSWVVLGGDVYAPDAIIIDATHPQYHKLYETALGRTPILVSNRNDGYAYIPHGYGRLDSWDSVAGILTGQQFQGGPDDRKSFPDKVVVRLSGDAWDFLVTIGYPLTHRGWAWLASNMPAKGWPAKEIIEAMADSGMRALIPIDFLGHLTDRNPGGLYMAREETSDG